MRSWMLARASPATGPLGEITRGREKFTQRVGIDGDGRRPAARRPPVPGRRPLDLPLDWSVARQRQVGT